MKIYNNVLINFVFNMYIVYGFVLEVLLKEIKEIIKFINMNGMYSKN